MNKIKYVAQKDSFGCAVACIAMVTGIPYDTIAKEFCADFKREGMRSEASRVYICDHGFSVIEVTSHGYQDVHASNARMSLPFAEIHVVTVQPFADSQLNHDVVMDSRGRVFDPEQPKVKDFSHYYAIVCVLGLFDDRKKR